MRLKFLYYNEFWIVIQTSDFKLFSKESNLQFLILEGSKAIF